MATIPTTLKRLPGKLREDIATPVYIQIASILMNWINSGMLHSGTLLPAERAMCAHFGVSRMTLREAYDILERDRLIERHRGRGTFVAVRRFYKQQQEMRSFTEELKARGVQPSSKLLDFRQGRLSLVGRQFFAMADTEMAYFIKRLRFGNGEPLAIETIELPCYLCPELESFDLGASSLYSILEEHCGLDLLYCVEEISAQLADRSQKKMLQLKAAAAVLVIDRKTYTKDGVPVEIATTVYRSDRYRAIVHATRTRQTTQIPTTQI
jgi:GntR family transcriptional regulator